MTFRHAHDVSQDVLTEYQLNGPAAHVAEGIGVVGRAEEGLGPVAVLALASPLAVQHGQVVLARAGAEPGDVLRWDGTGWTPAAAAGGGSGGLALEGDVAGELLLEGEY